MVIKKHYNDCIFCSRTVPIYRKGKIERVFCSDMCRCKWIDSGNVYGKSIMPTGSIGASAELLVCSDLIKRGFHVFRSQSPSAACDLVVVVDDKTFRVEITTGKIGSTGAIYYGAHQKERFDVMAVVFNSGNIMYIPELKKILK